MLDGWGCRAVAADARAETAHFEMDWRQPSAVIVGSEAHGLSGAVRRDARTARCRVPLASSVESLNAAVAGSIVLYEAGLGRGLQGLHGHRRDEVDRHAAGARRAA